MFHYWLCTTGDPVAVRDKHIHDSIAFTYSALNVLFVGLLESTDQTQHWEVKYLDSEGTPQRKIVSFQLIKVSNTVEHL